MEFHPTIVLLRIPYSLFFLPVSLFAMAMAESPDLAKSALVMGIMHLLLFPASLGYNGYTDNDKGSVGGLRHPPKPTKELRNFSALLALAALILSASVHLYLMYLVLAYVITFFLFSWHGVRFKKYALTAYTSVCLFHGFIAYSMVFLFGQGVSPSDAIMQLNYLEPAIISFLMVAGIYPITQVYQHIADRKKGDMTISRIFTIRGTFQMSAAVATLSTIWLGFFFTGTHQSHLFYLYISFLFPNIVFFFWWAYKVWADPSQANFRYTHIFLRIAAISMSAYFVLVMIMKSLDGVPFSHSV